MKRTDIKDAVNIDAEMSIVELKINDLESMDMIKHIIIKGRTPSVEVTVTMQDSDLMTSIHETICTHYRDKIIELTDSLNEL